MDQFVLTFLQLLLSFNCSCWWWLHFANILFISIQTFLQVYGHIDKLFILRETDTLSRTNPKSNLIFLYLLLIRSAWTGCETEAIHTGFFKCSSRYLMRALVKTLCLKIRRNWLAYTEEAQTTFYNHYTTMYLLFRFLCDSVLGSSKTDFASSLFINLWKISLLLKPLLLSTPIASLQY